MADLPLQHAMGRWLSQEPVQAHKTTVLLFVPVGVASKLWWVELVDANHISVSLLGNLSFLHDRWEPEHVNKVSVLLEETSSGGVAFWPWEVGLIFAPLFDQLVLSTVVGNKYKNSILLDKAFNENVWTSGRGYLALMGGIFKQCFITLRCILVYY